MDNTELANNLVNKSIEAFITGLELYNKPTIKYRIEGFSFFICNAWELMLKARLLNKNINIYYKDKPNRTITLTETVHKIYPDKNTRTRLNLEKIIDLRNISTHFITEDYEAKYAPLFQACVINYITELDKFHSRDITKSIPQNFLVISAYLDPLSNEEIKIKYPPEIAEKLIQQGNEVDVLSKEYNSDKFTLNIAQNLYITKKRGEADFTIKIQKDSNNSITIAKELKDPSNTHKYSFKNVVTAVQERLKKANIRIDTKNGFNSYILNLLNRFYNIKQDKKYAYEHKIGKNISYTYSEQYIEFIMDRIKENPNKFVASLKKDEKR